MENCIRDLRKAAGVSQEELAKQCGVSRQTINAIENNKYDPTLSLAFSLAKALGTKGFPSPSSTSRRWKVTRSGANWG